MKKILLLLGALFSQKSIAGTAITTTASAFSAWVLGFDIWPWVIGALGASIAQVYKPPETRMKALANSAISVFVGGVIAPFLASSVWLLNNFKDNNNAIYAMAFILSTIWPWVIPVLFNGFINLIKKLPNILGLKND